MSLAMAMPEDLGIPSEVLAEIQAAHRTLAPILDSMRPMVDIIERQRGATEAMREVAMQAQPPRLTRRELADLVHLLQGEPLLATAHPGTVTVSVEADQAAIALLPQTPQEAEEVERGITEIKADPELRGELRRLVSDDDWAELRKEMRKWTPWAVLAWFAWRLSELANSPVTGHLTPDQIAVVQNRLVVLAVIAALVQIIFMTDGRD
jgi:hypothetical protein